MTGRDAVIQMARFAEYVVFVNEQFVIAKKEHEPGVDRFVIGSDYGLIEVGDLDNLHQLVRLANSVITDCEIPF